MNWSHSEKYMHQDLSLSQLSMTNTNFNVLTGVGISKVIFGNDDKFIYLKIIKSYISSSNNKNSF